MLRSFIRLIPQDVMEQSRAKAIEEPIRLKQNWVAWCLFILVWLGIIVAIILRIFRGQG